MKISEGTWITEDGSLVSIYCRGKIVSGEEYWLKFASESMKGMYWTKEGMCWDCNSPVKMHPGLNLVDKYYERPPVNNPILQLELL